jgi:hypothetical protein
VIRRGFWLATGAVTGIVAYRRVSTAGHWVSGRLNPGSSPRTSVGAGTRRGTIRAARETYRFTRDVREGMALYTARQSVSGRPTLSTNHDAQLKDGH